MLFSFFVTFVGFFFLVSGQSSTFSGADLFPEPSIQENSNQQPLKTVDLNAASFETILFSRNKRTWKASSSENKSSFLCVVEPFSSTQPFTIYGDEKALCPNQISIKGICLSAQNNLEELPQLLSYVEDLLFLSFVDNSLESALPLSRHRWTFEDLHTCLSSALNTPLIPNVYDYTSPSSLLSILKPENPHNFSIPSSFSELQEKDFSLFDKKALSKILETANSAEIAEKQKDLLESLKDKESLLHKLVQEKWSGSITVDLLPYSGSCSLLSDYSFSAIISDVFIQLQMPAASSSGESNVLTDATTFLCFANTLLNTIDKVSKHRKECFFIEGSASAYCLKALKAVGLTFPCSCKIINLR